MSEKIPFKLPKSLASYLEQFEKNPEKTIGRFKKQLQRRGPDAVGYFLLGWFYYRQQEREEAIECALKAKTLAPGSPFFDKLHYYFSHPELFDARYLSSSPVETGGISFAAETDLNILIEKLSRVESKQIEIDPDFDGKSDGQAYEPQEVNGIVSETLAKVHEQQGNNEDAIRIYRILKKIKKERADFYDRRIKKLKKLQIE